MRINSTTCTHTWPCKPQIPDRCFIKTIWSWLAGLSGQNLGRKNTQDNKAKRRNWILLKGNKTRNTSLSWGLLNTTGWTHVWTFFVQIAERWAIVTIQAHNTAEEKQVNPHTPDIQIKWCIETNTWNCVPSVIPFARVYLTVYLFNRPCTLPTNSQYCVMEENCFALALSLEVWWRPKLQFWTSEAISNIWLEDLNWPVNKIHKKTLPSVYTHAFPTLYENVWEALI